MKVKFLPLQPHCFAFGGFDIQINETSDAIKNNGINISKLDIWSRDSDFDVLHCWGLSFAHYENYSWAKKARKKLVATILLHDHDTFHDKFRFKLSKMFYKQKLIKEILKFPDAIVVVNENQANICEHYFDVPSEKVNIIPHVVGDNFFKAADEVSELPAHEYILTVGNVCQRKNQLLLAKACVEENVRLVIIGKILEGEYAYANKLSELVKENNTLITWVRELKENSNELIGYYKGCSAFALPSFVEQQPISMLEAATLKKPILTANKIYAHQKYYSNAYTINPNSIKSIGSGINEVLQNPQKYITNKETLMECSSAQVGEKYKNLYLSLVD